MIVDCHVNVYEAHQLTPLFSEGTAWSRPGSVNPAADADTIHAAMDGVDRAILFSRRYVDSAGIDGNDEVTAAAVAKYPDTFTGFAAIDPRRPDTMELLTHAIETLGLKGVKFGPIYSGVSLLDPRMAPVLAYCEAGNLPLTLHMGTTFARNAPIELGRPMDVDTVALRHPDLKMVLAHMAHPWMGECVAVVRKHPNVYCEISALCYRPWQYWNALITAQEYRITERDKIFWGTDFPFAGVAESIEGLRRVNDQLAGTALPRISEHTIEAILHSNPFDHWWHGGLAA
jgi:predicted TIM-barrel fold metal-dependent hydrolase